MAKVQALELTYDERDYLEAICRTRTIQAQIMNRARIILLKADGESIDAIAEKVGMNRNSILTKDTGRTVSWWKEYAASMKQSKTDGQSVPWFIARNSFPAGQRI